MSLVDIQNALASLTTLVHETEVNHKKRADEHEERLDKRLAEITQTFSNQNSALQLDLETFKDNTKIEIIETNKKIDKEAEATNSFMNNLAESARLLALDSKINHAYSQMKAADLEVTTRSFCVYGLPGTSDSEIDAAFTSIFSIATATSEPIKDTRSEITGAPGKKLKIFTATDVNTAINTITLMRKIVSDYKANPDRSALFSKLGVGDYYYRSCIPVRSALHSKGRFITEDVPWVNYCSIRLNRNNPEIFLLANPPPDIANRLKAAEKQTHVKIDVGTQLSQFMEMNNFNFRPAKNRRSRPALEDPTTPKDSISTPEDGDSDNMQSRDSSTDSRNPGLSFAQTIVPSSTRGGASIRARGRASRASTPKRKAGQTNSAEALNVVSKKSSLGKN